jgi:hypothetical protein
METNLSKLEKFLRFGILALFTAFFIFLLAQKFVPAGELTYETDFQHASSFIEGPFPVGRVTKEIIRERAFPRILAEPVYFRVYTPQPFSKAKVTLRYRLPEGQLAKFGLKLNVGDFSFFMEDLESSNDSFVEKEMHFDLKNAWRKRNKIQLIVSVPGVESAENKLIIDKVQITFIK